MKPLGLLYVASLIRRFTPHRVSFIDCLDRFHPGLTGHPAGKADGRGPFPKEEIPKPDVRPRRPPPLLALRHPRRPVRGGARPRAASGCRPRDVGHDLLVSGDPGRRRSRPPPFRLRPHHRRRDLRDALPRPRPGRNPGPTSSFPVPAETGLLAALAEVLGGPSRRRPDLSAPDALPPPAFDLLRDRTWLPVLTSRGCPLRCTYCASSLLSPGFEQRPAASVLAEILGQAAPASGRGTSPSTTMPFFRARRSTPGPFSRAWPRPARAAGASQPRTASTSGRSIRRRPGSCAPRASCPSTSAWNRRRGPDEGAGPESVPGRPRERPPGARGRGLRKRRASAVYLITGLPGQSLDGVAESVRVCPRPRGDAPGSPIFRPFPGTAEWASPRPVRRPRR